MTLTVQKIWNCENFSFFKIISGGLWGSKLENKLMRQLWTGQWIKMLEDPLAYSDRSLKGPDEKLLDHYVWPWAQFLTLSHDSF